MGRHPGKHTVFHALETCLEKKLNFAAFRLPSTDTATLVIQKEAEIKPLRDLRSGISGKGFLISGFSGEKGTLFLIRPDMLITDPVRPEQMAELGALPPNKLQGEGCPGPENTDRKTYLELIREAIEQIKSGQFEKVVLSRTRSMQGDFLDKLTDIFARLCNAYPEAFVYLFRLNGQCWMGATPEPFVCSNGNDLFTVSLAGTRPASQENLKDDVWNDKERLEQEYVTRHIEKILHTFSIKHYAKKGPYTARAGNLLHLRTDFTFSGCLSDQSLCAMIRAMHPTPAVCGMSPGKALDFIKAAEKHDREYYSGYLGPVGLDENLHLYVNLRCMKVLEHQLVLYVGGGITRDSDPEAEWEETELKAETLLAVIQKV